MSSPSRTTVFLSELRPLKLQRQSRASPQDSSAPPRPVGSPKVRTNLVFQRLKLTRPPVSSPPSTAERTWTWKEGFGRSHVMNVDGGCWAAETAPLLVALTGLAETTSVPWRRTPDGLMVGL